MSVRILRYRYRGWDEPELHPVQDARWALTQLYDQHPDASISVLIAHGDREHMTDPRLSYQFAVRAKQITSGVRRFDVHGDGHAMLRRAHDWPELATRFLAAELGLRTPDPLIENAMHRRPQRDFERCCRR